MCLSHNSRKRVNKLAQRQRAGPGGLRLEGKQPLGQTMWVQPGTRLICCLETSKHGLYNSQLLEVVTLGITTCDFVDFETRRPLTLTHAAIQRHTRSAAAMTYANVQGRDFEEVGIWTASAKFSQHHLFMALSQARSGDKVWIMDYFKNGSAQARDPAAKG